MERLLEASKELAAKVESNEAAAGELLKQTESLQEELKTMRQVRTKHAKVYIVLWVSFNFSIVSLWK